MSETMTWWAAASVCAVLFVAFITLLIILAIKNEDARIMMAFVAVIVAIVGTIMILLQCGSYLANHPPPWKKSPPTLEQPVKP